MSIIKTIAAVVLVGCSYAACQQAPPEIPKSLSVTVDTQQTADPVSKYVFGSFIEHIGTLIYRSMWTELIDDRKFYFPISSKDPGNSCRPKRQSDAPAASQVETCGPGFRRVMDPNQPFVGDHSPKISLEASTSHGIRQAGFSLVNGKHYTGRIYLRGKRGHKGERLSDLGPGRQRQAKLLVHSGRRHTKNFLLPLRPRPIPPMQRLRSLRTGSGDLHVGAVSLMPSDNVQGFRPDTIALLKAASLRHVAPARRKLFV